MSTSLIANRNFQLHWLSGIISQTGNYFTFVALPWLVLSITNNNPIIMSTVMATASLPQAFFMLFGGVLADRFSPLRALYISRILFALVMASLALVVYTDQIALWTIYVYAFTLGILGAISIPSGQALLPAIVNKSDLGLANGLVIGSSQLAQILGPLAAGWLIWLAKSLRGVEETQTDHTAIATAFAVDALAVFIAIFLMLFIRVGATCSVKENVVSMFKQGLIFCWRDKGITMVLVYLTLVSFFLHGTLMAGLPIFTKFHLELAERAYGNLYAMIGIGTIIGIGLGVLMKPSAKQLGGLVLGCDLLNGLGLFLLGKSETFFTASICLVSMGVCAGIVMVAGTTWFQQRTPDHLMGRVISILMFSILGLIPISASLVGWLMSHYSINSIMSLAGIIIFVFSAIGLLIPGVRNMGSVPITTPPDSSYSPATNIGV